MRITTAPVRAACNAQAEAAAPLGTILLARTRNGLAGAWFAGQKHHPAALAAPYVEQDALLQAAMRRLDAYFDGMPVSFDLPLDPGGTPFQRRVWAALLEVPRGTTRSYADIARALAIPAAVRAVAAAIGRNPLSIIVPCHRVVGSNGALTGYAGGIGRKTALLALERRAPETAAASASAAPAAGPPTEPTTVDAETPERPGATAEAALGGRVKGPAAAGTSATWARC
jgi:methylated-DNA-[protein]-cysteine S-methyltransferase